MDNNVVAKHILDVAVGLEKKSKTELIAELSDIFDNASKIDLNSKENIDSLKNLAKAFEAIFSKAGKSFDLTNLIKMPPSAMFSEMGKIAATSFWDAWNSVSGGIGANASKEMLREQFNQLNKQRTELIRQQKALPKKIQKYEDLSSVADDLPYMDENEFEAFTKKEIEKMGSNIDKIALDMQRAMVDALDKLSDVGFDDPKYDQALEDAFEKARNVFKMSRTLEKNSGLVKDKTILGDYDFKYLQETFGEDLEEHSIRLSGLVRKATEELDSIPVKLNAINNQLLQIQNSGIEIVDQVSTKNGLKTLNEIEEAYKRILTKDKKRAAHPDKQKVGKIENSLAFDPSTSNQGIQTLYDQYLEAQAGGVWEEEYQSLLKYVRLYEEYLRSENKTHRNKVTRADNPFTPLYEQLKPMADNAQNALQNIVNMAKDQPLVGMGGTDTDKPTDTSDEVANAQMIAEAKRIAAENEEKARREADAKAEAEQKAAEEAERQAKAEKEKVEAIKQQRVEADKIAKAAERERVATDKAVASRQEELWLMQAMNQFQSEFEKTDKKNETLAFVNTQTGNMSELFVGDPHSVTMDPGTSRKMAELGYDMEVHSHSFKTAAPSIEDLESWKNQLQHIKKFGIRAGEELLAFDFSKLDDTGFDVFLQKYKDLNDRVNQQLKELSFDGKVALSMEHGGIEEAIQSFMRRGLEDIVKNSFPNLINSIKMPDLPIERGTPQIESRRFVDVWAEATKEVRELIKELAILEYRIDELEEKGIDAGDLVSQSDAINAKIPEEIRHGLSDKDWESYVKAIGAEAKINAETAPNPLVEKYKLASEELKHTYQEIVAIQDQIDELESQTQRTSIDIDPWNATKDQKDQIISAWREYQKVIQEIADMPVVETDDDEKRLLELKAKAVSLYETMRQGHLNDVLGDGYAKEYGLSIEDGKQMHLDMQDEPRKDFENAIGGLRSKLDEAYTSAQKLDQEMYVMMLRADDDSIESFYTRLRQDAEAARPAIEAVNDAIKNTVITQQNDYNDDDSLAKENGALEDKLELLRDIAEQYGNNVTQKQRDRLEELNQKDMNDGLTPKEDERYWELSEQIDDADKALEEFGETYDRIIVKLENGKSVEILPDDKGLRTLAKIDEEYGESYNGIDIEDIVFERVKKEAVHADEAVGSLNNSIQETEDLTQGSGGVGAVDTSVAELEAATTQANALQDELEQKNKELVDKDAEVARIQAESEAKLQAEADEKARLQEDLSNKDQQLADVQHENELYDSALNEAREESNVKDGIIRELREQLANVKTGVSDEQTSVAADELKRILGEVVYNVKIAHDDTNKEANKIAIDEGVLENTLKKVFTNVLNPHVDQENTEPKNEPWALEKTLLSVKEVLDVVKVNTSKTESIEVAPAKTDVGHVLATENTLVAIKNAVEAIKSKTSKGGGAKSSDGNRKKSGSGKKNSESFDGSRYFPEKLKTQTMQLAKFRASLMTTGKLTDDVDALIYELLNGLNQIKDGPDFSEWMQKFQQLKTSVGITDIFDKAEDKNVTASYRQLIEYQKERNKLELQYEKAQEGSSLKHFYAEQLAQMDAVIAKQEEMLDNEEQEAKLTKIRAEQERKLGEIEAKAADKDAKKSAADAKKLAKRQAMTGKAGSAIGRAENTWLEAESLNQKQLPAGFKKQVNEYYDALDKLRLKHHEINTSDIVTEKQQSELIEQTAKVNKLTGEIGELVAEYQKLSGSNVDETNTRADTLGSNASISEREQQLKQYVKEITDGKAQIKSFNAETGTLTYTVKTGKNEFTEYTAAVRRLDNQLVSVQGTTKRTETFFEATMRKMKELTSYFSGMAVFNRVGQELRRGIQYVREIDLALTELKKVTDETEESYDRFLETAAKTADKVGSTIQKVVSSTADWARLGYSMEQAAKFAETTQILMNVSEFTDVSQATDTLISAVQAFGYTADTSMDVVDLLNTIGNNYAISTADLAQSLTKSSASLVAAGGNLAEAAALTATANAIIQDADSVGTALKTTSLRLRGTSVKILEEEGLDSDGAIESTSKLRSQVLATSGVDILTDSGAYKSTYQILLEIAEVWDQITDDKARAGLLELLAGKRNSSVIAALLQNPEQLKAAYEDAQNASGSALKENEKYLDSIQGKIDQFNNAMQTMWSNLINDEFVKGVVEWGTKIIKSLDTTQGKILAIVKAITLLAAFKKINPLDWVQNIDTFFAAFQGKGLKDSISLIRQYVGQLIGITPAIKAITAETIANTVATQTNNTAEQQAILQKMGLVGATGALNAEKKKEVANNIALAVTNGKMTVQMGQQMAAMLGYTLSVDAAGKATVALDATTKSFMATNPIGWTLTIVSVLATVIMLLSQIPSEIEKLTEKISDLESELSSIESELDSLNSELKTSRERMAELLSMPSLSFIEQEELANLQSATKELERQLEIEEALKKATQEQLIKDKEKYIDATWNSTPHWFNGDYAEKSKHAFDTLLPGYSTYKENINAYEDALTNWEDLNDYDKFVLFAKANPTKVKHIPEEDRWLKWAHFNQIPSKEEVEEYLKNAENSILQYSSKINNIFNDENLQGLHYGMSDAVDKYLDEYYAYWYKWQESQGIDSTSSAIASIFNDTSSESIKKLKDELTSIASDDSLDATAKQEQALAKVNGAINSTTGNYDRLKTSMDVVGITAKEVAEYFTRMSKATDSSTVDGITAQYQKGVEALSKYKGAANDVIAKFTDLDGTVEQITWGSLFDDEGKTIDTQISKVLQGANETTRAEFARIAKSVNEGTMSIETAMSSFSGSGLVAVSKLIEESFGELNKSVFKGLEDEISGFIDTFSEFSAALEDVASSMDLLHTAQEQYNNSGQVSVKTALELMQSTDQWNKILTVENGKITLNTEAQDILVQSKLNTVKANLAEAKASIQNQLAQLGAADATLLSAEASDITTEAYTIYTNAMNSYTASIAGFGAALDALVNGRIFGDDGIMGSFQSAYNATKEVKTYENTTNIAALREKLAEVDQMEDFFEGVDTFDEFKNNYDFDENPGDKYGEDEDSKTDDKMDAFQREMDYWENRIAANQARYEQLQNEIDLLETKGQKADASFYQDQIRLENQRLFLLGEQKKAALAHLATLEEGSEEWWEVANTLNDIESELDDVTASIVDLQDAIGEIDTYKFEEFNTRLDDITRKLGTIRDLIAPDGEEDWFDNEGNWTEDGVAVLGSYIQELETYKNGLAEVNEERAKYDKSYTGNEDYYASLGIHSEQEYYDKVQELTEQQYDYAQSISDTEQSVVDMYESNIDAVEEYTETLIDSYNDYIDSVKEALDAERDYTL